MSDEIIADKVYIDKVIETVARVHDFVLSKDDPVLATATLNKVVVTHVVNDFKKACDEKINKLSEAINEQEILAKEQASEIIKSAIEENEHKLNAIAEAAANKYLESVKKHQNNIEISNEAAVRNIKTNRNLTLIFSLISLVSMLTTITIMLK